MNRDARIECAKKIDLVEFLKSHYSMTFDSYDRTICPFHNDHDPSLSVFKSKKDGCWRWHCLGCGEGGDILDFLKLKEGLGLAKGLALLREMGTDKPCSIGPRMTPVGKLVASYDYADESGVPLYRRLRFEGKKFRMERFANGKWISALNGTRRVLYDLPQLVRASEVLLLEGEKDCETVKALGFTATTMGSVNQWKAEFAAWFKDKDVYICFDVGNEKQAARAASDITRVAKSVKILGLPGLTEREQDITDWFERMGETSLDEKRTRLLDVVEKTRVFEPAASNPEAKPAGRALTLTEFLKKDVSPRDIFMDNWVEREHLTILAGPQKAGKSILSVNLGLSLAYGKDFLGFKVPHPRRVLYVQQEISEPAMLERLRQMTSRMTSSCSDNFMIENTAGNPLKLSTAAGRERLRKLLADNRPDLLILDPLSTFHDKEENSSTEMATVLETISELKSEFTVGILLIHHFGKPSLAVRKGSHRLRGSSVIGDRADSLIMLDPVKPCHSMQNTSPDCYGQISFDLRNDASPSPIAVVREPTTLWYKRTSQGGFSSRKLSEDRIVEIVRAHGGQIRQSDLERQLKGTASRGTVLKAIGNARKTGLLVADSLPERGKPVLLKLQGGLS